MRQCGLTEPGFVERIAFRFVKVLAAYQSIVRLLCELIDWSLPYLLTQVPLSLPEAPF